jgi:hypothetical protein
MKGSDIGQCNALSQNVPVGLYCNSTLSRSLSPGKSGIARSV